MTRIVAPWSEETVIALNRYQCAGEFHPFTCGMDHPSEAVLVAHQEGWRCPVQGCTYTQTWAHAFMATWSPKP